MNLLYCLRRGCRTYPHNVAVRDRDRTVTYRQFWRRVHQSAATLRGLGLAKDDRISVLLLNSPEYLELYYSTLVAGAVIVPLNTRWNIADIAFSINDSGSRVLVVDDKFAPMVPEIRAAAPLLETIVFTGTGPCPLGMTPYEEGVSLADPAFDSWSEPAEDDLAGLFYTSGTTGGPKGVMLTHRNLYANTINGMDALRFEPGAVWLHAAPMFHAADISSLHALSAVGATHIFLATFDPEETLRLIEDCGVTNTVLVPTMVNMVVNHANFGRYNLSTLRYLLYGASPMPLPLLEKAMECIPCKFAQGYGLTEASPLLTVLLHEDHKLEDTDRAFAPVKSAGRPAFGVEVRVVDENDCDVPVFEVGEIIARGANIMVGYWNRPEINQEILRGGWLHTGDAGSFDEEGFLYILDRKKDMIKPGGENVYSPDVESSLMAHPDVLEAAVIGVPHPKWGETIRAVITRRDDSTLSEEALIEWCRASMTHFKCPTSVVFVDSLPKGGTGKVQKNVLRHQYGSP
ncbi:MAG: long-chain-fatty-acid--CoA ligase [Bryobacteraceae bacterium]